MILTNELKPCTRCGGKLRPVKSADKAINALYCESCRALHLFNDEYGSMEATIDRYNRVYNEQTGAKVVQ